MKINENHPKSSCSAAIFRRALVEAGPGQSLLIVGESGVSTDSFHPTPWKVDPKSAFSFHFPIENPQKTMKKTLKLGRFKPRGIGKSSLLRAAAGLWADGCGEVQLCHRRMDARTSTWP